MGPRRDGPPPFRKMILPALFVGGLFYVTFTRSPDEPSVMLLEGEALGTTWSLKVAEPNDDERRVHLQWLVEAALAEVDQSMSTYRADSELMGLNRHEETNPFAVSDMLDSVLTEAMEVGTATTGAFDVTVGPLVDAWGFGPDGHQIPPSDRVLAEVVGRVGQDKIRLQAGGVTKSTPDVFIDLSAIAKGYAVDHVVEGLQLAGVHNLLMEVGGEIVARGQNPNGQVWRLGIETPSASQRQVHHAIPLENAAMATSGDYRQYYEHEGLRVSHLIDPRTSRPIEHRLASVTVVAKRCSTADAWATALSIMGDEEGFNLAEKMDLQAYFIVRTETGTFTTRSTTAFKDLE